MWMPQALKDVGGWGGLEPRVLYSDPLIKLEVLIPQLLEILVEFSLEIVSAAGNYITQGDAGSSLWPMTAGVRVCG